MIKKIFAALVCLCVVAPSQSFGATLRITQPKALLKVLEKHLPNDKAKQAAVMQVYADSLNKGGGKISTNASSNSGLGVEMCKAVGWVDVHDLSTDPLAQRLEEKAAAQAAAMPTLWQMPAYGPKPTAEEAQRIYYPNEKCKALIKDIVWAATGLYYNLCGVEKLSHIDGQTKCVRSFYEFQGQIASAIGMAKEWAKMPIHNEFGKDSIICEDNFRTISNDDYIRCKSVNTRRYYEFQFDDVRESFDNTIRESIISHIYWLHGVSGIKTSQQKCNEIAKTAEVFNVKASYRETGLGSICALSFNDKTSIDQLRTSCGINPFELMVGDDVQINATLGIDAQLRGYVAEKCGINADDVMCTLAAASYTGDGGEYANSLIFDGGDDIITCSYSQKDASTNETKKYYIDFVFDDTSEHNKVKVNAGNQAMGCIVKGGTYNGKECMHLNKTQCDKINETMTANCPSCNKAYWDAANGMCVLPDAASETEKRDAINAALLVVGTAAAIVITVVTAGTGAVAIALVVVETSGAIIEGVSTHQINEALDEFFKKSGRCKDASCAPALIKEGMERIVDFANDMEDGQVRGFDTEMARLFMLLPPESEVVQNILDQYSKDGNVDLSVAGNKGGFFDADSWQPEQVWRAVGVAMQFTSVFASIGNWLFKGAKATQTVLTKTDDAIRVVLTRAQAKRLDDLADLAADLTKRRQAAGLGARQADDLARRLKSVNQERQTLVNSLGLADQSDDVIKLLQREAYLADDLAKASDDLAKATTRADNLYTINKNGQRVLAQGVTKHDVRDVQRAIDAAQSSVDDITRNLDDVTKQLDDIYGVGKTTTTVVTTGGDDAARALNKGVATGAAAKVAILEGRNQLLKPDELYTSPHVPNTDGVVVDTKRDIEPLPELAGITGTAVTTGTSAGLAGMSGTGNGVQSGTGATGTAVTTETSDGLVGANNGNVSVPELSLSDIEIEDDEIVIDDVNFDFKPDALPEIKPIALIQKTSTNGNVSVPELNALPDIKPIASTQKTSTQKASGTTSSSKSDGKKSDVEPHAVKDPRKTGLIATAAVLGAVGTGLLVGGLVSRDKDDDKKSSGASGVNAKLEKDLETILNNSDKSLGIVNGNMIKLVPMPTTNGTDAKIVNINGNAVAVVDYRGRRLPYYVNAQTGSWIPLLGIGKTGGWFNTYLSNPLGKVVEQVQRALNQQLKPAIVAQFVGANALGVQFPMPALDAYNVINAEFPNGVVETFNGTFSPSDQALYNDNYNKMKNIA